MARLLAGTHEANNTMTKADYNVVAILPGRRGDYCDFWTKDVKVNALGEALHSGMLAITVVQSAKNKSEAERLVQAKYPGHSIDTQATDRIG